VNQRPGAPSRASQASVAAAAPENGLTGESAVVGDVIRLFPGENLVTTVPRVTTKEVVVRNSGEHTRRTEDRLGQTSSITDAEPSTLT
jgi:hypothetical protein